MLPVEIAQDLQRFLRVLHSRYGEALVSVVLFGSWARGEARAESDIDLLVTFAADAEWSLLDHVQIEHELSQLLGRKVDLVSRRSIEASRNAVRRNAILRSAVPVYVAG